MGTRTSAQELHPTLTTVCSWLATIRQRITGRSVTAGPLIGERKASSACQWARTHAALLMKPRMSLRQSNHLQLRFEPPPPLAVSETARIPSSLLFFRDGIEF